MSETESADSIAERLHDADSSVRYSAMMRLADLGDPRAIPSLAKQVESNVQITFTSAYWALLIRAVAMLAQIPHPDAVSPLVVVLSSSVAPHIRAKAAWALGTIGQASGVPALVRALDDPSYETREAAANGLEKLLEACPADISQQDLMLLANLNETYGPPPGANRQRTFGSASLTRPQSDPEDLTLVDVTCVKVRARSLIMTGQAESSPKGPDPTVRVKCACGEEAMVPASYIGRTGKCRRCGTSITVSTA